MMMGSEENGEAGKVVVRARTSFGMRLIDKEEREIPYRGMGTQLKGCRADGHFLSLNQGPVDLYLSRVRTVVGRYSQAEARIKRI